MPSFLRLALLGLAALGLLLPDAPAQRVRTVRVASGLDNPLFVTSPPGDAARLFILEQNTGRIRILKNGSLLSTPFLDIGSLNSQGGERGLLGMAFHPDYASNGRFFINYTNNAGDTVIAEYQVSANPDVADASSARTVMTIGQPFSNHNGGMLAFGPDGYLYIGTGDGGDANDPFGNGQNPQTLLGKMLRIDVDGGIPYGIPSTNPFVGDPTTLDEIWALGLRNPWRYAFDRETGDLWIADVGQGTWEEVDFEPAGSPGGINWGWDQREGAHWFQGGSGTGYTDPIYEYQHTFNPFRCSITGGYVYRGSAIPGLQGTYWFAEWCSDEVWSFRLVNGQVTEFTDRTAQVAPGGGLNLTSISSMGEDANGELYFCDHTGGEVFMLVPDLMQLGVSNLVAGQTATFSISQATPGATVYLAYSLAGEGLTTVPQLDVTLGILSPVLLTTLSANGQGSASHQQAIPANAAGVPVWIQAAESGNTSNVVAAVVQ